jgi:hypothetical protein
MKLRPSIIWFENIATVSDFYSLNHMNQIETVADYLLLSQHA